MPHQTLLFHTWRRTPPTVPRLVQSGWYDLRMALLPEQRKCRPEWVLDYSLNRHGRVRVGSDRAPWSDRLPGIAHLYPPGTPYWEDTVRVDGAIQGGYVVFEGGDAVGLRALVRRATPYVRIEDAAGRLADPLQRLASIGHSLGDDGYWRALSLFATVLDLLRELHQRSDGTFALPTEVQSAASVTLSERSRETMLRRLSEPLSLARLAASLHVSPSTLSHRFRRETGLSPMQALIGLRLNKAQALLRTGMTLEEIARQTGFCDAFHLSKSYKRRHGASPRGPRG
jgi:AraC-like DNA-binding protein